jgi:hypothetical protein
MSDTDKKKQPTPAEVLRGLVVMVESDLMKAKHYMEKGISIALLADDKPKAEELAAQFTELTDFLERYQTAHATLIGEE